MLNSDLQTGTVIALPTPVKYGVYALLGGLACAVVAPLSVPIILGIVFGVGAAGPVAGGLFAGFQAAAAGGAIAAGIVMGAALPAIGYVGAGIVGAVAAVGARALAGVINALGAQ
ncbi:hypothetical protein BDZ89DRAFT_1074040 [Hymenopellis radicata]|nr:hypothetical protein BDZ89DRAFT_1074040 [Hymenopellis radicata]